MKDNIDILISELEQKNLKIRDLRERVRDLEQEVNILKSQVNVLKKQENDRIDRSFQDE